MSKISCNLSYIRKQKRLRQTDLSKMTGISQKALSELETGKSKGVSFSTLSKLCDALECGIDDLFELMPDENTQVSPIMIIQKPSCSFCGTNESKVEMLVIGQAHTRNPVYICSECIDRSHGLLVQDRVRKSQSLPN